MFSANHWGGSFEINNNGGDADDDHSRNMDMDRAALSRQLDETQQSWLLGPQESKKKDKYVDLGCVVVKRKLIWWAFWALLVAFIVVGVPIIVVKSIRRRRWPRRRPTSTRTRSTKRCSSSTRRTGKLPKNNGIPWRGDSGLKDGSDLTDVKGGLVGGYYDAGDNIKFTSHGLLMTLLSWSVVEYSQKYKAIGEYDHVRRALINSTPQTPLLRERPEDMDYPRPVQTASSAPDLAGEVAAALASASIVFNDDAAYSKKLVHGAATAYKFARDLGHRQTYSRGNPYIEPYYNSTGYWDEYMWSAAWMYYATGNTSYISLATDPALAKNAKAFMQILDFSVFSWDNKLPGAELLLTRLRMFLNPGYPYEETLSGYHNSTGITMCMGFKQFHVFNWTQGGLIELNHGRPQPLQYAVNMAFLASLYADYMDATNVPGWYCGPNYFSADSLRSFAKSQVDYVLGNNPRKMSYLVGYGSNYPKHVHHRGASIPHDGIRYSCTGGWKWLNSKNANPNLITGAMVAGPDKSDGFSDVRTNYQCTEPTLAGNAGLVAALVSLTSSGGGGIDKNTIFSAVPPLYPAAPPPPAPWKP
ncbi:Endoglucanase 12 [Ananas comosus]|uniref:Endoglucanase n=1 Tax=Ananas comosus TaxID=4615 RepID=A0A199V2H4_ANACO|nr:Endoglucanase 12 [Ananas comosus]